MVGLDVPRLSFGEQASHKDVREPSITVKKLECLKQAFA